MSTKTQDRLLALLGRHEDIVLAALDSYRAEIEASRAECTRAGKECQAAFDQIKDDPEALAAQDAPGQAGPGMISVKPTASGLSNMARMFTEGAAKHARTLAALDELSEALNLDEDQ
jgi:hypothetical protein